MKKEVVSMNRMGLIGLIIGVLLVILVTPAIATSSPTISLEPEKGTVGTTVKVVGDGFGSEKPVTVYFNVNGDLKIVNNTVSTDTNGHFEAIFKVPEVPPGTYKVVAVDEGGNRAEKSFTVIPIPVEMELDDLGIAIKINKTVLRTDEKLRVDVGVNKTKLQTLNITIVIIDESAWKSIDMSKPVMNKTIVDKSTWKKKVENAFVATISITTPNKYYIVVYNTTNLDDYIDMYVVAEEFRVEPSIKRDTLNNLSITWDIVRDELNVSDVNYTEVVKLPINATREVNIAILKQDDWNELYENISVITKNDIFNKAKWFKENFKGNVTHEIETEDYGLIPGVYVVVVFNTTQSGYIYYYNNSTTFSVYPLPEKVSLSELGVDIFNISRTTIRYDESLNVTLATSKEVRVAIINESTWNEIDVKGNVQNRTIMGSARPPWGWNITALPPGFVESVSGLLPDRYIILIYNVIDVGGTHYLNQYNVPAKFEVTLKPALVNLADLNITRLEVDKTTVNYGDSFNLTINVTGTVRIVIINESAWNELMTMSAIRNETIVGQSQWNMTVNNNITVTIDTLNRLMPNKYIVVVYNTTTVGGVEYVNWYNDSLRFTVIAITKEVSLTELGVESLTINTTKVAFGGCIKITLDWNESVTSPVNIAILNETNWMNILNTSPTNNSVLNSDVWNRTNVNSDLIETISITSPFSPDRYVIVVYNVENGVIVKYNDDCKFDVFFEARKVNLTDLVRDARIVQYEKSIRLEIDARDGITINVAILREEDWKKLSGERSILNETLLNESKWKEVNIRADYIKNISIADWEPANYVVVIYNISPIFTEYVNWYNDSLNFRVSVAPANITVIDLEVTPESIPIGENVIIKVTVHNYGGATGSYVANVTITKPDGSKDYVEIIFTEVAAGETVTMIAQYKPDIAGNYIVEIDGLNCTFTVLIEFTTCIKGWYMISVPLESPITCDKKLGEELIAFAWDAVNQTYVRVTTLEPGRGYWVLPIPPMKEMVVTFAGSTSLSECEINLTKGWNLIGTIAYEVHLPTIVEKNNLPILKVAYTWDPVKKKYVDVEILEPGKAYWVYAFKNTTLKLTYEITEIQPPLPPS